MRDPIKKIFRATLIALCILFSISTQAATFTAGVVTKQLQQQDEDVRFEQELGRQNSNLHSAEPHLVIKSMQFFSENFDKIVLLKAFPQAAFDRIFSFLNNSSENLRSAATTFIEKNISLLLNKKFISPESIQNYAANVYFSPDDAIFFLSLIKAVLHKDLLTIIPLNSEYGFNIIDGLSSENEILAGLASDIYSQYGALLVEKNFIERRHISRFVLMLKDIPESNHEKYMRVFQKNFAVWVNKGLMDKEDAQNVIAFAPKLSEELEQQLYDFLKADSTVTLLEKLGVFDRAWAEMLLHDIMGTDDLKKQTALDVLAYLLRPFVNSKALSSEDFKQVWNSVCDNLDAFDAPFLIITANFKNLSQHNWFTQKDYDKILSQFSSYSDKSKELVISFLDQNYDWLRLKDWISMTPLSKALFEDKSDSRQIQIQKLRFLQKHDDLARSQSLFTHTTLQTLFIYAKSKDPEIYGPTFKIINAGFSNWNKSGILTKDMVAGLFKDSDINSYQTSLLIGLIAPHVTSDIALFDKTLMEYLGTCVFSDNPKVAKAAKLLFSNNIDVLRQKKLINGKTKQALRDANLYAEDNPKIKHSLKKTTPGTHHQ